MSRRLQKICTNIAGRAANAAPLVKANVVGKKTGEYAAYLAGSNIPFVIILWAT